MPDALVARVRFGARVTNNVPAFALGSDVAMWVDVTNTVTQAPTDDATIAVVIYQADGEIRSPALTLTKESTGVYYGTFQPDQAGIWTVTPTSDAGSIDLRPRRFEMTSETPAPAVVDPTAVLTVNGEPGPHVTITGVPVSITDYGGVSGAADNSDAWAALIAYCTAAPGRIAYLPAGTWTVQTAPGTIPTGDDNQVEVPALTPSYPLVIQGAGQSATTLKAKVAARTQVNEAPVTWPILRLIGGPRLELRDLTIDGGVSSVPATVALTLSTPGDDAKAPYVCTMIETDETTAVVVERVTITGFYGHRDQTEWPDDPSAFRGRRTAGLCIHRAETVTAYDLTLGTAFREGIYFLNCVDVVVRGFRYIADRALQIASGGQGLSTPLDIFGPETERVTITDSIIRDNNGSAINGYASEYFVVSNCSIGGTVVAGAQGDGMDFGSEISSALFGADHPPLGVLMITDTTFTACARYSLRVSRDEDSRGRGAILDGVTFHKCYQGPEFYNIDAIAIGSMVVMDAVYRSDYSVSGRGLYIRDCARVSWGNLVIDGSGGTTENAMKFGIILDGVSYVSGGTAQITDATRAHVLIYPSSADPEGYNNNINLGDVHCWQVLERAEPSEGEPEYLPLQLGRNGEPIDKLSVGKLTYNGTPAITQADIIALYATEKVEGLQTVSIGTPDINQGYRGELARIQFVNGDGSSGLEGVRGNILVDAGWTIGRGASIRFQTSTRADAVSDALTVLEHGGIVLHDTAARSAPVSREAGEMWHDDGTFYVCTVSGSVFSSQLSGVTATADGSTDVVVSSATGISPSNFLTVGGALRRVMAVAGTSVTLSATVTAGTGLAVLYAVPTIKELAFVA